MITIEHLNYRIADKVILKDINLNISNGEKIALIGPSGAGKSTFLNILTHKVKDYQGHVKIHDITLKDDTDSKILADHIGIISQSADLIDPLSVYTNVIMGQFRHWSLSKSIYNTFSKRIDIHPILEAVHMTHKIKQQVASLSGGEKQRVSIARLMYQNPKIVLADEPVASLDPKLSHEVLQLLTNIQAEKTMIVSLHQEDYALKYFDRIIALKDGQIFFDLKSTQIKEEDMRSLYDH